MTYLFEKEGGFSLNVASTSPESAAEYARRVWGRDPEEVIPGFDANFRKLSRQVKRARNVPRGQMPVVEPKDISKFQAALITGKLDLFAPYAKRRLPLLTKKDKQIPLKPGERRVFLIGGWRDGDKQDDRVAATFGRIPAGKLKPIQNQVWLEKLVNMIHRFGPPKSGSRVLDTTIIVSKDGYIIDGHHRWAQAVLADPSLGIQALRVPFPLEKLLSIAKTYGAAIGRSYKEAVNQRRLMGLEPGRADWCLEDE